MNRTSEFHVRQGRVGRRVQAECFNEHGQSIIVDWEEGPNPVQITLQMIGACSLADIEIGLKDRAVSKIWIELDGERARLSACFY